MRVAEALENIPEVDYIALCTGSFDMFIELVCTDAEHRRQTVAGLTARWGLRRTTITFYRVLDQKATQFPAPAPN